MCISVALLALSTTVAVGSAIQQGKNASAYADYQQRAADEQARQTEAEGRMLAERTRKAGRLARSDIAVASAASGLDVNSQSVTDAITQTDQAYETDALSAIYSSRNQAASIRAGGQYAASQGQAQRRSALMSGANAALRGWAGYQGMQQQAALGDQRRELAINRSRG